MTDERLENGKELALALQELLKWSRRNDGTAHGLKRVSNAEDLAEATLRKFGLAVEPRD